jgi:hypothetical protein
MPPRAARPLLLTDDERAGLAELIDQERGIDETFEFVLRAQQRERVALYHRKTAFWRRVAARLGADWPVPFDSNWTAAGNIATGEIRVSRHQDETRNDSEEPEPSITITPMR